jgi:para-aminobenzoate synthetase component I
MHRVIALPAIQLNDVLLRLDERSQGVFALNSTSSNGWGTVVAWNPAETLTRQLKDPHDTVASLEHFSQEQRQLGRLVMGYLSYDFGCLLHNLVLRPNNDLNIPLTSVSSFASWITFDRKGAYIHSADHLFISEVKELIRQPARKLPSKPYRERPRPRQSRHWYRQSFRRVEDYIRAGDVYQVNLTHRLEGTTTLRGQDLFCLLSRASHADFQAYMRADEFEILSFSPERFIRTKGSAIETSPIKGTRARGATRVQDTALRADLLTNPKDIAELNMITDLMRNDLGAICRVGSVSVKDIRIITGYPTLWHAHSTITGKLRPDISPITALANLMPGGSITGCPKKRAMEIIDELEPQRRNIYSGSIFIVHPEHGELDSSIAIRTIMKKANRLHLSVGGGIVSDSAEADEYKESIDKAASFMGSS